MIENIISGNVFDFIFSLLLNLKSQSARNLICEPVTEAFPAVPTSLCKVSNSPPPLNFAEECVRGTDGCHRFSSQVYSRNAGEAPGLSLENEPLLGLVSFRKRRVRRLLPRHPVPITLY